MIDTEAWPARAHDLRMNAGHRANCNVAVPQIVEADPRQAVTLDRAGKLLRQTPRLERLAVATTDDQLDPIGPPDRWQILGLALAMSDLGRNPWAVTPGP